MPSCVSNSTWLNNHNVTVPELYLAPSSVTEHSHEEYTNKEGNCFTTPASLARALLDASIAASNSFLRDSDSSVRTTGEESCFSTCPVLSWPLGESSSATDV